MKLLIIGAGGQGRVVAEIATLMNKWEEIAFLDDREEIGTRVNDYKVLGKSEDYVKFREEFDCAFVAIGENKTRMNMIHKLEDLEYDLAVLIHPCSSVSENVKIGKGSVVMAGTVISTNTRIGKGCIINTSASVDHDCLLGNGVHISPGVHLGGIVTIGNNSWIGIGTTVIHNIRVGRNVLLAAGTVVINDIQDNVMIVGVPGKIKKYL